MDDTWVEDSKTHARLRWLVLGGAIAILIGGMLGASLWQSHSRKMSLLPVAITQQIQDFRPYFYIRGLPAGYSFDASKVSYSNNVLSIILTKSGNPSMTLNEQRMPADLSDQAVQQNGQTVNGTAQPATINSVEGRYVGTMVADKDHTLILITSSSNDINTGDLTALLVGLQPVN